MVDHRWDSGGCLVRWNVGARLRVFICPETLYPLSPLTPSILTDIVSARMPRLCYVPCSTMVASISNKRICPVIAGVSSF